MTRRVVIALDSSPLSELAIELSRHVSAEPLPELLGLLVEDEVLLEHARAPLARELMFSGEQRPFDAARLERDLRARAELARERFETAAKIAGGSYDFKIARGHLIDELLNAAEGAEAMVLPTSGPHASRSQRSTLWRALSRTSLRALLFLRDTWGAGDGIVVLAGANEASETLDVAARVAARERVAVRILPTAAAGDMRAVVERVRLLASPSVPVQLLPPAFSLSPAVISAVARSARLVIVPSSDGDENERLAIEVLTGTRASLLLVRR